MLFDTHCHLNHEQFATDQSEVMARAEAAGVGLLTCIGHTLPLARTAIALAEAHDWIYATVGLHPHDARDWTASTAAELAALAAAHPRVRAIGEIGLDYHYDFSLPARQHEAFRAQIHLARQLHLPIVIHAREADADILAVLREEHAADVGGIMHCFAGDWAMAKQCLEMNFNIGIGGSVTFAKNQTGREVAVQVPLERIVLETDAPYLAPVPFRGKRNEPAHVAQVCRFLAELRRLDPDELAAVTTENAKRTFRI